VDPGPVWTGAENLTPHRDSIPGPSSLQQVAIPTTLSRSTIIIIIIIIIIIMRDWLLWPR
jgi:hypothetical protein